MSDTTVQVNPAPQSSVEISVSTKGVTTYTVKVYDPEPGEALAKAKLLYANLQDTYGRPDA